MRLRLASFMRIYTQPQKGCGIPPFGGMIEHRPQGVGWKMT